MRGEATHTADGVRGTRAERELAAAEGARCGSHLRCAKGAAKVACRSERYDSHIFAKVVLTRKQAEYR